MRKTITAVAVLALATAAGAQFKPAPAAGTQQPVSSQAVATPQTTKPADPLDEARRITIKEAQKLVAAKKAVYVDVRGTESYNAGHIKGALNISGSDLTKRLKEIPKGRMIIAYCA